MNRQRDAASRALWRMPAVAAKQRSSASAPINEEQALFDAAEPLRECLDEGPAEDPPVSALKLATQIDDANVGKRLRRRAFAQLQEADASGSRRGVTLYGRCGAAQQQHAVLALHSLARNRGRLVARNHLLFVRRIMRFVDDEQPYALERRENRAAGTDDDVDLAPRARLPRIES